MGILTFPFFTFLSDFFFILLAMRLRIVVLSIKVFVKISESY